MNYTYIPTLIGNNTIQQVEKIGEKNPHKKSSIQQYNGDNYNSYTNNSSQNTSNNYSNLDRNTNTDTNDSKLCHMHIDSEHHFPHYTPSNNLNHSNHDDFDIHFNNHFDSLFNYDNHHDVYKKYFICNDDESFSHNNHDSDNIGIHNPLPAPPGLPSIQIADDSSNGEDQMTNNDNVMNNNSLDNIDDHLTPSHSNNSNTTFKSQNNENDNTNSSTGQQKNDQMQHFLDSQISMLFSPIIQNQTSSSSSSSQYNSRQQNDILKLFGDYNYRDVDTEDNNIDDKNTNDETHRYKSNNDNNNNNPNNYSYNNNVMSYIDFVNNSTMFGRCDNNDYNIDATINSLAKYLEIINLATPQSNPSLQLHQIDQFLLPTSIQALVGAQSATLADSGYKVVDQTFRQDNFYQFDNTENAQNASKKLNTIRDTSRNIINTTTTTTIPSETNKKEIHSVHNDKKAAINDSESISLLIKIDTESTEAINKDGNEDNNTNTIPTTNTSNIMSENSMNDSDDNVTKDNSSQNLTVLQGQDGKEKHTSTVRSITNTDINFSTINDIKDDDNINIEYFHQPDDINNLSMVDFYMYYQIRSKLDHIVTLLKWKVDNDKDEEDVKNETNIEENLPNNSLDQIIFKSLDDIQQFMSNPQIYLQYIAPYGVNTSNMLTDCNVNDKDGDEGNTNKLQTIPLNHIDFSFLTTFVPSQTNLSSISPLFNLISLIMPYSNKYPKKSIKKLISLIILTIQKIEQMQKIARQTTISTSTFNNNLYAPNTDPAIIVPTRHASRPVPPPANPAAYFYQYCWEMDLKLDLKNEYLKNKNLNNVSKRKQNDKKKSTQNLSKKNPHDHNNNDDIISITTNDIDNVQSDSLYNLPYTHVNNTVNHIYKPSLFDKAIHRCYEPYSKQQQSLSRDSQSTTPTTTTTSQSKTPSKLPTIRTQLPPPLTTAQLNTLRTPIIRRFHPLEPLHPAIGTQFEQFLEPWYVSYLKREHQRLSVLYYTLGLDVDDELGLGSINDEEKNQAKKNRVVLDHINPLDIIRILSNDSDSTTLATIDVLSSWLSKETQKLGCSDDLINGVGCQNDQNDQNGQNDIVAFDKKTQKALQDRFNSIDDYDPNALYHRKILKPLLLDQRLTVVSQQLDQILPKKENKNGENNNNHTEDWYTHCKSILNPISTSTITTGNNPSLSLDNAIEALNSSRDSNTTQNVKSKNNQSDAHNNDTTNVKKASKKPKKTILTSEKVQNFVNDLQTYRLGVNDVEYGPKHSKNISQSNISKHESTPETTRLSNPIITPSEFRLLLLHNTIATIDNAFLQSDLIPPHRTTLPFQQRTNSTIPYHLSRSNNTNVIIRQHPTTQDDADMLNAGKFITPLTRIYPSDAGVIAEYLQDNLLGYIFSHNSKGNTTAGTTNNNPNIDSNSSFGSNDNNSNDVDNNISISSPTTPVSPSTNPPTPSNRSGNHPIRNSSTNYDTMNTNPNGFVYIKQQKQRIKKAPAPLLPPSLQHRHIPTFSNRLPVLNTSIDVVKHAQREDYLAQYYQEWFRRHIHKGPSSGNNSNNNSFNTSGTNTGNNNNNEMMSNPENSNQTKLHENGGDLNQFKDMTSYTPNITLMDEDIVYNSTDTPSFDSFLVQLLDHFSDPNIIAKNPPQHITPRDHYLEQYYQYRYEHEPNFVMPKVPYSQNYTPNHTSEINIANITRVADKMAEIQNTTPRTSFSTSGGNNKIKKPRLNSHLIHPIHPDPYVTLVPPTYTPDLLHFPTLLYEHFRTYVPRLGHPLDFSRPELALMLWAFTLDDNALTTADLHETIGLYQQQRDLALIQRDAQQEQVYLNILTDRINHFVDSVQSKKQLYCDDLDTIFNNTGVFSENNYRTNRLRTKNNNDNIQPNDTKKQQIRFKQQNVYLDVLFPFKIPLRPFSFTDFEPYRELDIPLKPAITQSKSSKNNYYPENDELPSQAHRTKHGKDLEMIFPHGSKHADYSSQSQYKPLTWDIVRKWSNDDIYHHLDRLGNDNDKGMFLNDLYSIELLQNTYIMKFCNINLGPLRFQLHSHDKRKKDVQFTPHLNNFYIWLDNEIDPTKDNTVDVVNNNLDNHDDDGENSDNNNNNNNKTQTNSSLGSDNVGIKDNNTMNDDDDDDDDNVVTTARETEQDKLTDNQNNLDDNNINTTTTTTTLIIPASATTQQKIKYLPILPKRPLAQRFQNPPIPTLTTITHDHVYTFLFRDIPTGFEQFLYDSYTDVTKTEAECIDFIRHWALNVSNITADQLEDFPIVGAGQFDNFKFKFDRIYESYPIIDQNFTPTESNNFAAQGIVNNDKNINSLNISPLSPSSSTTSTKSTNIGSALPTTTVSLCNNNSINNIIDVDCASDNNNNNNNNNNNDNNGTDGTYSMDNTILLTPLEQYTQLNYEADKINGMTMAEVIKDLTNAPSYDEYWFKSNINQCINGPVEQFTQFLRFWKCICTGLGIKLDTINDLDVLFKNIPTVQQIIQTVNNYTNQIDEVNNANRRYNIRKQYPIGDNGDYDNDDNNLYDDFNQYHSNKHNNYPNNNHKSNSTPRTIAYSDSHLKSKAKQQQQHTAGYLDTRPKNDTRPKRTTNRPTNNNNNNNNSDSDTVIDREVTKIKNKKDNNNPQRDLGHIDKNIQEKSIKNQIKPKPKTQQQHKSVVIKDETAPPGSGDDDDDDVNGDPTGGDDIDNENDDGINKSKGKIIPRKTKPPRQSNGRFGTKSKNLSPDDPSIDEQNNTMNDDDDDDDDDNQGDNNNNTTTDTTMIMVTATGNTTITTTRTTTDLDTVDHTSTSYSPPITTITVNQDDNPVPIKQKRFRRTKAQMQAVYEQRAIEQANIAAGLIPQKRRGRPTSKQFDPNAADKPKRPRGRPKSSESFVYSADVNIDGDGYHGQEESEFDGYSGDIVVNDKGSDDDGSNYSSSTREHNNGINVDLDPFEGLFSSESDGDNDASK